MLSALACNPNSDLALLDEVSGLVEEHHYDSGLHGMDWQGVTGKYHALVEESRSRSESLEHINAMLQELGDSHCGIGPSSGAARASSPYLFAEGTVGLDVRLINGQAIISRVEEGSPSAVSGLHTGFNLVSVDKKLVKQIIDETQYRAPFTIANKIFHQTEAILWHLFGTPGLPVEIGYLDAKGVNQSVLLQRVKRSGGLNIFPSLPPIYVVVEEKVHAGGITQLRFNAFQPDEPDQVLAVIDRLDQRTPLILDLRGNNGGSVNATLQILGRFVQKRLLAFNRVDRHGETAVFVAPENPGSQRAMAVLVDEMSISAAENFAAIVQQAGLAQVIGVRTPGQLLWGEGFELNGDVLMVIPTARMVYPDGSNIEGIGVEPDLVISLNQNDLLRQVDTQLEAAITHLTQMTSTKE